MGHQEVKRKEEKIRLKMSFMIRCAVIYRLAFQSEILC